MSLVAMSLQLSGIVTSLSTMRGARCTVSYLPCMRLSSLCCDGLRTRKGLTPLTHLLCAV